MWYVPCLSLITTVWLIGLFAIARAVSNSACVPTQYSTACADEPIASAIMTRIAAIQRRCGWVEWGMRHRRPA